MPVLIHEKPASDFSDPIGLLSDCHRRIQRFLSIMVEVARAAAGGPLEGEQRMAVEISLRYFREAAPKHTADEEESLFPRLLQACQNNSPCVAELLNPLQHDHSAVQEIHETVNELMGRWLADNLLAAPDHSRLVNLLQGLQDDYSRHIAQEETEIFPLATAKLDAGALKAIGLEMAKRRGIKAEWLTELNPGGSASLG